jgi:DNA-binding beta-propeller fold protein YncE
LTTTPVSIDTTRILTFPTIAVAITPDGTKAYVTDQEGNVLVLHTSDLSDIATIPQLSFGIFSPWFIALSPNKPEGYVSTGVRRIFVINTDTNTVASSFDLPVGSLGTVLNVTPNGNELYIVEISEQSVFYVTLSDNSIHTVSGLPTATFIGDIAIAPDGTAAYVVLDTGSAHELVQIDTTTHSVVNQFSIPSQLDFPFYVAITPDGQTACVTDQKEELPGQYVVFIDLKTGSSSTLQLGTTQSANQYGVAITPDQAPTARFTQTISGATVTFDGSSSSSPVGAIETYAWDFGDGQTLTTSSPTTSHTYSTSGTFSVTLTVTNTAGTSTEQTFTGQTASNNGGPSAVTTQQITVQTIGVASFKGKTRIYHKSKKIFLKTKWSKLLSSNPSKVVIYERNKKVSTMKASHRHHKLLRLHPHHLPHKVSYDYREYLEHKYNIRVVDSSGHVSEPTYLHIVNH